MTGHDPVEFAAAIDLLGVLLRNGPRAADDCEKVALLVGLDSRLFRDARQYLGIEETSYSADPNGPGGFAGRCFWHFGPKTADTLEKWRDRPEYRAVAGWMPERLTAPDAAGTC